MSYSLSTFLTRNLHDVFGENDPARRRVAIDEMFTEDCVFYDPRGASTGAETRSIESRARLRLLILTSISANSRARRRGQWRAGPIGIGPPRRGDGLRRYRFHYRARRSECRHLSLFRQATLSWVLARDCPRTVLSCSWRQKSF